MALKFCSPLAALLKRAKKESWQNHLLIILNKVNDLNSLKIRDSSLRSE